MNKFTDTNDFTFDNNVMKDSPMNESAMKENAMKKNAMNDTNAGSDAKKSPFSSLIEMMEQSTELSQGMTSDERDRYIGGVRDILAKNRVNILLAGATGAGKSTTINALFNMEEAKVGYGTDPETREIEKYTFSNLTLWDTPGFGDSPEKDRATAEMIRDLLKRNNDSGHPLIDLVLVVVDGSSRDMMSTFELITKVIAPGVRYRDGIVVAINQTDVAMKGRHWDSAARKPEPELTDFMTDKVRSVKERIRNSCDLDVNVMFYSATEKFNLLKLMCFILENLPDDDKMLSLVQEVNRNDEVWQSHDEETRGMVEGIIGKIKGVVSGAMTGAAVGAKIATSLGIPPVVGTIVGGFVGGLCGLFS